MPVERIYIAHIKGCNINLKKYGTPSYRQVKLFPQADNYRLGVSKSYQPLSTLSPLIETGSRYIVDIFYFSHFLDCILDIALYSLVLTTTIVFHSRMAMVCQQIGHTREQGKNKFGTQLFSLQYHWIPMQHPAVTVRDLAFEGAGQVGPAKVTSHLHGDGDGPRTRQDISLNLGWAEMELLGPWAPGVPGKGQQGLLGPSGPDSKDILPSSISLALFCSSIIPKSLGSQLQSLENNI